MIKIIEEKPKSKKHKKHYLLIYEYMIGDANGHTSEEVIVSFDNPFLERYVKLLGKLKAPNGRWGLSLDEFHIKLCFEQGQISKDDFEFLKAMMFEDATTEFEITGENEDFSTEFWEGVKSQTGYSFLTLEKCELLYYDEWGRKYQTKII